MRHLTLLLIAVVSRIGSGLATTVSALFVTQVVGLNLRSVGLALTATTAVAVAGSIWLGHLADRLGAREMFAAMFLLETLSVVGLVFVSGIPTYVVAVLGLAIADLGGRSSQGALIHAVVPPEERLELRAKVRVAANIGVAAGAGLGGIALAIGSPTAYRVALLTTAAMLLITGTLVFRLPRVPAVKAGETVSWAVLRDRPFVLFMGLNGVLNIHNMMLNLAVPVWIATRTNVPHWMVSVLIIVNTSAVILFQLRLTRGTDSLGGAARAGRRAGLLLCLSCAVLSITSLTSTAVTITLLVLAALAHVGGEILESASGWGASYALAPPGLVGQYQGAHAMGRGIGDLIGPVLLTTVAIPLGPAGWLLVAIIFAAAGMLIPAVLGQAGSDLADQLARR
ncbi:MFS transporter [Kribbella sp. NPDC055071]